MVINAKDNVANICWYDINPKDSIYEEIDCPSNDLYMTINRILDIEGVETYHKDPFINRYYCKDKEKYKKFQYESTSYKDKDPVVLKDIDTKQEVLMGLYDKYYDKTLKGYIDFAKHIAQLDFVTDYDFEYDTSIDLKINKQKTYYGKIHFNRNNGYINLKLLVQYEIRSYMEKMLRIN